MTTLISWWHELNTTEPEEAMEFYEATLGWVFDAQTLPDGGSYWIARQNSRPVAGIYRLDPQTHKDVPSHWMTYMAVPDMTGAEQVAALAGGSIVRKAVPLDGIGTLSVVSDPTGAMIGLIEPDPDHALARAA